MIVKSLYHGTDKIFDEFEDEYMFNGNAEYGLGFYFTNDIEIARKYTNKNIILKADVEINKPIKIQYDNNTAGNPFINACEKIQIDKNIAFKMLCQIPILKTQPNDQNKLNPLGDYIESYWEKEKYSNIEFKELIIQLINKLANGKNYITLYTLIDLLYDNFLELRNVITKYLGYDGVIINQNDNITYVTWYAKNIQIK